tara:strand:+ start:2583 stop:2699 length:117 start_codon:yes stop_codon:yes gene_type:complete
VTDDRMQRLGWWLGHAISWAFILVVIPAIVGLIITVLK